MSSLQVLRLRRWPLLVLFMLLRLLSTLLRPPLLLPRLLLLWGRVVLVPRFGAVVTPEGREEEEEESGTQDVDLEEGDAEGVLRFFCVCAPGLEALLRRELLALRLMVHPPVRLLSSSPVAGAADISSLSSSLCKATQQEDMREKRRQEEETAAAAARAAAAAAANTMQVSSWAGNSSMRQRTGGGGVEVVAPLEGLWNICMRSRLVESVRVRVGPSFLASKEDVFLKRATRLPWEKYLPLVANLQLPFFSIRVHRSRLYHSKMLQELLNTAITQRKTSFINQTRRDQLPPSFKGRAAPGAQATPSHVHLHMNGNRCQVTSRFAGGEGQPPRSI